MTIRDAAASLRARKISSVELARESLSSIRQHQPRLNAFITVTEELALTQAKRADEELARGIDRGPLHGIPYALKDVFATKGIRTTCGSKIFADHSPTTTRPFTRSSPKPARFSWVKPDCRSSRTGSLATIRISERSATRMIRNGFPAVRAAVPARR